jgi:DNA-binding transcriptional LysR family regulator
MHEVNLHGVDLNLLPPLEALLRRRNVTHAAADAGLSQPAMSRALSRLRHIFDDQLLVRTAEGFVLTTKAQSLLPRVVAALGDVKGVFEEPVFDPSLERRTIRLVAVDAQTILLLPGIMARLAREAPGIDVRVEQYGRDLFKRMENGSLDLAFAVATTALPPGAMSEPIAKDRLALVMRRGHAMAKRAWTVADYGTCDHAGIAIFGDGRSELDAQLAAHGVTRRLALVTPHFIAALAAVSTSDLVTTISEALARRFIKVFDLVLLPPPLPEIEMQLTIVWSHLRNGDKLLTWFRQLVRDVAREVHA